MLSSQYGATIFQSVGISDSYVTQIILGAVNFGCTFGGMYVMEKVRIHSHTFPRLQFTQDPSSSAVAFPSSWEARGSPLGCSCLQLLARPSTQRTTKILAYVRAAPLNPPSERSCSFPVMIVSACLFILGYAMTWAPYVHLSIVICTHNSQY